MQYLYNFVAGVLGVFGFSILLRAPKRSWFVCSLSGGVLYVLYLLIMEARNERASLLIICILASFGSMLLGKLYHMISVVFVSAAIISLVPGFSIFKGITLIFAGKMTEGFEMLTNAMILIVIMVIGLWLGTALFQLAQKIRR